MGTGVDRALWNIAKTFATTPDKLYSSFTALQWEWAIVNYNQDIEDRIQLIRNCYETLQPWLNPELYQALKKRQRTAASPAFSSYIEGLRARGVTEDELKSILQDMGAEEQDPQYDTAEVIAAPWMKNDPK